MKDNIGKGTEVFAFMGELFKLMSNYWIPENEDKYFENLIKDSEKLLDKYKNCDFFYFAKGIVVVLNVYLSDIKLNGKKAGHWEMSFKAD